MQKKFIWFNKRLKGEVHNDLSYKRLYHILNNNEVPIDPHFTTIYSLIFIFLLLQRVKKLLKFVFTI